MQNTRQISKSRGYEPPKYEYKKSSYVEVFEVLQSLRRDDVFCDIKLETDDGAVLLCHKVILASASPYFHAMFTNFAESNKNLVVIRQFDSTALELLVDFIYSGEIVVTENNVQVLLPAANLLQLHEIKEACCDFLQTQLHPTNCIGIKALADLHSCMKLLTSSELYMQQHFSKVIEGDEFLSLSSEQIVKMISSDELTVPSEEKVFECVIRWVEHDLGSRKSILPQLMEHVRLPLTSKKYILKKVVEEPLLNNCTKCKDYIIEALQFHLLESDEDISITQNIRTKHRHASGLHKVFFVVGGHKLKAICSTEWYDPKIDQWQTGPDMIKPRSRPGLAVLKDNFVFAVGGGFISPHQSVEVLDLSSRSPCWKPSKDMIIKRKYLGVGVINNYIYAVGGHDGTTCLNSAEVFDSSNQEWRMVSSMATRRAGVGVGVLNNLLYVVGGYDHSSMESLNSVECYLPGLDTWTPVAEMSVRRCGAGVGVLDGVLYAVGGLYKLEVRRSVEAYRPSTGVWTTIADMHMCRLYPGVVALDGLLYVVGGTKDDSSNSGAVECYNPKTNTWTMVTASLNVTQFLAGVVAIDRPPHFKTCILENEHLNYRYVTTKIQKYFSRFMLLFFVIFVCAFNT